jgi:hypothetical protein
MVSNDGDDLVWAGTNELGLPGGLPFLMESEDLMLRSRREVAIVRKRLVEYMASPM